MVSVDVTHYGYLFFALIATSILKFESKIFYRVLGTGEKNMIRSLKKNEIESTIDLIPILNQH